jgi:uncharacterized protein YkwD
VTHADDTRVKGLPRARRILPVLAGLVLIVATTASAGEPPANGTGSVGTEAEFLSLLNGTRVAAGLAPLELESVMVGFARGHTREMVDRGDIFHSEQGTRLASAPAGWRRLGENVGVGSTPERLHALFMNSPGHRDNILGDYTGVAIGAQRSADGQLYVTVVFLKRANVPQAQLARKD